jgi:hypothetical protein
MIVGCGRGSRRVTEGADGMREKETRISNLRFQKLGISNTK